MKIEETKTRLRKWGFVYFGWSWMLQAVLAYQSGPTGMVIGANADPKLGGVPNKQLWDANRRLVEYIEANFEEVT